ncbi:MAG TPA: hypothetical protein VMT82_04190 [candidate division Zixibacteria bacterium]|nr:hypothetical protein [candidate division Zixibacteria bacterium]
MRNPPPDIDYHTNGTKRGEEWSYEGRHAPGMEGDSRTARDATGINADKRKPIDPRMPDLPPA